MSQTNALRVKNLGIEFDNAWVFRNLSFTVKRGESIVLIGPSGGGKSVLFKIIAGLVKYTAGEIVLETHNLGMLFQRNALFDSFTVLENLTFTLKEAKGTESRIATPIALKLLESVGLSHAKDLYPSEISGGMQKRLGIARALIARPDFLLYDEPTAGLDPITSRRIANLILDFRKESSVTTLTITNDMQRAYQLADRIWFLAKGKLKDGGTPEEIHRSKDPEIRQFIFGLLKGPLTVA